MSLYPTLPEEVGELHNKMEISTRDQVPPIPKPGLRKQRDFSTFSTVTGLNQQLTIFQFSKLARCPLFAV